MAQKRSLHAVNEHFMLFLMALLAMLVAMLRSL